MAPKQTTRTVTTTRGIPLRRPKVQFKRTRKSVRNAASSSQAQIQKVPVPPSQVSMAPVAIGNTIRGYQSQVKMSKDTCLVTGRDFCFTPIGTGSVVTWTLVGGAPLTPAAFVDSTLRQYLQMYNKFRFRRIIAHYITSSPTTSSGDIMFYFNKNRESPFLNQTSANLLPYVISDPHTVLGPQWQNHSASFPCSDEWRSTDYGIEGASSLYADGDLFLLSKTTTTSTESPGYVLFDYMIEFKEHSIIPRVLTLPLTKILWTNVALNGAAAVTVNTPIQVGIGGSTIAGVASALPTGTLDGDIFKVIFDKTNSILGANSSDITTANIINITGQVTTLTLVDGTTFYAVYSSGLGGFDFYPSLVAAQAGDRVFNYSATNTIGATTLQFWFSYVGAIVGVVNQPNF